MDRTAAPHPTSDRIGKAVAWLVSFILVWGMVFLMMHLTLYGHKGRDSRTENCLKEVVVYAYSGDQPSHHPGISMSHFGPTFHCLNLRDFCPILRAVRAMLSKKDRLLQEICWTIPMDTLLDANRRRMVSCSRIDH